MARHTSVLLIVIYSAQRRGAKCCYHMLAAIFSSQKRPRRAANTISRYIPEIRWALSAAVPSASCLLSSYREIMSYSPRTAIANSDSFIIWEQKDLILSMLLCLGEAGGDLPCPSEWKLLSKAAVCRHAFVFKGEMAMFPRYFAVPLLPPPPIVHSYKVFVLSRRRQEAPKIPRLCSQREG